MSSVATKMDATEKKGSTGRYECDYCPRTFSKELYLQLHSDLHSRKAVTVHQCPHCDRQFLAKIKLDYHVFDVHYTPSDKPSKHVDSTVCVYCSVKFPTKLEMVLHKVDCKHRQEQKKSFPCKNCGKIFSAERFIHNHLRTCVTAEEKQVEKWTCDVTNCQKVFSKFVNFKNHVFTHTEYPFVCTVADCRSRFTVKENLVSHSLAEHGQNTTFVQCSVCAEEFSMKEHLTAHVERSHEDEDTEDVLLEERLDQSFSCRESTNPDGWQCKLKDCGQRFESVDQLREHYISHNQALRQCGKCNQIFSEREEMHEHALEKHGLKIRDRKCPFCDDSFSLGKLLQEHLTRRHPKPWKCEHCNVLVSSVSAAEVHRERHLVKQCDVCDEDCTGSRRLLKHLLLKHGSNIFSCPVQSCRIFFGRLRSLELHLLEHQKDKIFLCTHCDFRCFNMRQLECHLDSGHVREPLPHEFTSEMNIVCTYPGCNQTFVQERWMYRHKQLSHPAWDSESEDEEVDDDGQSSPVETNQIDLETRSQASEELLEEEPSPQLDSPGESDQEDVKTSTVKVDGEIESECSTGGSRPGGGADRKRKLHDMETDTADFSEKEFEFVNLRNSTGTASTVDQEIVSRGTVDIANKEAVDRKAVNDHQFVRPAARGRMGSTNSSERQRTSDQINLPGYCEVISQGSCPEVGDFLSQFDISVSNILNLTIPEQLKSEDVNIISKGLAIDLLYLASTHNLPNTVISRYFYALLPEHLRPSPSALSEEGSNKLVNRINNIRVQASRFRVRYLEFPKYLNKFLLEQFNPFI